MPYDKKAWKRRLAERTDLSPQLVHLTRDNEDKKLNEVLLDILSSKTIMGSSTKSGFICGQTPAVCFQDAPLVSVCQNVFFEQKYLEINRKSKLRYRATGISIDKSYAYNKGARPVFYEETKKAKEILPTDQWWRIVNFNLSDEKTLWTGPMNESGECREISLLTSLRRLYSL